MSRRSSGVFVAVPFLLITLVFDSGTRSMADTGTAPDPSPAAAATGDVDDAEGVDPFDALRDDVAAAYDAFRDPSPEPEDDYPRMRASAERLAALGNPVIPVLENDARSGEPRTFFLAVHALGLLETPESERVLRETIDRFVESRDKLEQSKAMWAAYNLALHGYPDGIDLLETETRCGGALELMAELPVMGTIAIVTHPKSVPVLLDRLERYSTEEPMGRIRLLTTLEALEGLHDPSTIPALEAAIDSDVWYLRRAAVEALGAFRRNALAPFLLGIIEDEEEDLRVRSAAAIALGPLAPKELWNRLVAHLETESHPGIRDRIYEVLARIDPVRTADVLRNYRSDTDRDRRRVVMAALARVDPGRAIGMLRAGLADEDASVAVQAVRSLGALGTPAAIELLLANTRDPRWTVAQTVFEQLTELRDPRVGPRAAALLIERELAQSATSLETRTRAKKLGAALLASDFTEPVDDVRSKIARQGDPELKVYLETLVSELRAIRDLGNDVDRWKAVVAGDDREARWFALERLARSGAKGAVPALVEAFDVVPEDERIEVLRALALVDDGSKARALPLLRRVVLGEAFDAPSSAELRAWAAFVAARAARSGDEASAKLLERGVERRSGIDDAVVVYWLGVAGKAAVPVVEALRETRFRWPSTDRAHFQHVIDAVAADIEEGREPEFVDDSPDAMHVH